MLGSSDSCTITAPSAPGHARRLVDRRVVVNDVAAQLVLVAIDVKRQAVLPDYVGCRIVGDKLVQPELGIVIRIRALDAHEHFGTGTGDDARQARHERFAMLRTVRIDVDRVRVGAANVAARSHHQCESGNRNRGLNRTRRPMLFTPILNPKPAGRSAHRKQIPTGQVTGRRTDQLGWRPAYSSRPDIRPCSVAAPAKQSADSHDPPARTCQARGLAE